MSEQQHTPGPWYAQQGCIYSRAHEINYSHNPGDAPYIWRVAGSVHGKTADEIEANEALIAAAPDLLALARQYASECGDCNGTGLVTITTWPGGIEVDNDDQPCPDCADIRAVIAKATQVQS